MPRSISPQKPHTASDLWHTGPGPHIQLPCRTACRRCLALPEPRVLAPALCSVAAVGTVQSDAEPGTPHATSEACSKRFTSVRRASRPHARLPVSLRWPHAAPAALALPAYPGTHLASDAGHSQHPPEEPLGWRPPLVSALNRTWLRKHSTSMPEELVATGSAAGG